MCRGEKYDGWPFISFGTTRATLTMGQNLLFRPKTIGSTDHYFHYLISVFVTLNSTSKRQQIHCSAFVILVLLMGATTFLL